MPIETSQNPGAVKHKAWFHFVLIYLVIEYGRPQDMIHIGFLRPGLIINSILIFFIIRNWSGLIWKAVQLRMMFLLIVLLGLLIPFAVNNYYAYQTTRTMFLYMPFVLSLSISVNTIDRLKKVIHLLVVLMIFNALYGIVHSGVGAGNYFADENDLGLYINMWLPFGFFLFFTKNTRSMRIVLFISLLVGLVGNIATMSRGGFLSMVSVAFVCWLKTRRKLLTLLFFFIFAAALYMFTGDAYLKEMKTIGNTEDGTAAARLWSWKAAWDMFLDNPWGVGGNNFQVRFSEYQGEWFQRGMWGRVAHSLWFTLLPELGVVGVVIFFVLLYYNFKDISFLKKVVGRETPEARFWEYLSYSFLASLVGYLSAGTFLSVLYYPHYWYLTALIIAAARIAMNVPKEDSADVSPLYTRQDLARPRGMAEG